jgi:hypothetical protein
VAAGAWTEGDSPYPTANTPCSNRRLERRSFVVSIRRAFGRAAEPARGGLWRRFARPFEHAGFEADEASEKGRLDHVEKRVAAPTSW